MSTPVCNPCAEVPVCLQGLDRYSLQDDRYFFVINCPPGVFCGGNNVLFLVCCDGTIMQQILPHGITTLRRNALINDLISKCAIREAFCNDGGPGGGTRNGNNDGTDPDNPIPYYGNNPQSYTSRCPDGLPFTYTVPAGLFIARTQEEADAAARNRARTLSVELRICLNSPQTVCCNNRPYASTIVASGGEGPFRWAIIGSLPTGLTATPIGNNGLRIAGIPTVNGNFTFSVRAVDSNGAYMLKPITIKVWGITDAVLPDGVFAADYTHQMTTTNGTPPYTYRIVSGSFPLALDISSSGLISGVVGEEGVFDVTLGVADATGRTCQKPFELTVPAAPTYRIVYWTMEETGFDDRVDSVSGVAMPALAQYVDAVDQYSATAIGLQGEPALFGNGFRIAKGLPVQYIFGGGPSTQTTFGIQSNSIAVVSTFLRHDGVGFSFCFWLKVDLINTLNAGISYVRSPFFMANLIWNNATCIARMRDTNVVHSQDVALPVPTVGVWTFYELFYDSVIGKMGARINDTTDYLAGFTPSMAASLDGSFTISHGGLASVFSSTGNATDAQDFTVDEVLVRMDDRLSVAQRAYLYNAGAGRTWPIVLP